MSIGYCIQLLITYYSPAYLHLEYETFKMVDIHKVDHVMIYNTTEAMVYLMVPSKSLAWLIHAR